jgi:hypothetical protein
LLTRATALRFLDADDFTDDNGEVDDEKLAEGIDQLVKDKPYLADKGARSSGKSFLAAAIRNRRFTS